MRGSLSATYIVSLSRDLILSYPRGMKLLFVCLGNICRSPTAEAVAVAQIKKQRLAWVCDSAGTSGYHDGETADPRSILHAKKRGYAVTSISRVVTKEDFHHFDLILAMDSSNLAHLRQRCPTPELLEKISLVTDYCSKFKVSGVPDPYYGGGKDFELVIDILEDAIHGLIECALQRK